MASVDATDLRLAVLSPGGRDLEQYFDKPVGPNDPAHAPVNLHSFAACSGGSFHRKTRNALDEKRPILLILRGDFRATERALIACKKENRAVAVALKETGLHQIAKQLFDPGRLGRFLRIVNAADGCIATTPETAEILRNVRTEHDPDSVAFIPTAYPLEEPQWNFKVSPGEQRGIFIGTREWNVPSRNHCAALLLSREICAATAEPVTVFNLDGRKGNRRLTELKFPEGSLRVHNKRMAYPEYLREMARHKIVFQLDRSHVPGQVAGDALLCRTICVGGDGAIERLAFANFCGQGRTTTQLKTIAMDLLKNTAERAAAIVESQWRAAERISFSAVREQLAIFFNRLGREPINPQPDLLSIPK